MLGDRLLSRAPGYAFRVEPGELDLDRFRQLVDEAAGADAGERADKLREALALWRGAPLADVTLESFAELEAGRLEELRIAALEDRIDADLELGRHAELVGELSGLIAEHPLQERLRGQLMLALYRSGRQAEALEVFRETRRLLDEELGLEPSPELRELERAILRQDPALARPAGRATGAVPAGEAPARDRRRTAVVAIAAVGLATASMALGIAWIAGDDTSSAKPNPPTGKAKPDLKGPKVTKRVSRVGRPRSRNKPAQRTIQPLPPPPAKVVARKPSPVSTADVEPPPPPPPPPSPSPATSPPPAPPPPVKPKPPPTPALIRIEDAFSDGAVNPRWFSTIVTGTGTEVVERYGRLEVAIGADAVAGGPYNVIAGHIGTHCRFPGDFDARVDFELLVWPPANGVAVQLNAFFADANVGRSAETGGDAYTSWINPYASKIGTSDAKGRLRIKRAAGIVTTYFWNVSRWIKLDSGRTSGSAVIAPQAVSDDKSFAHVDVRVGFDNFVVQAKTANCS